MPIEADFSATDLDLTLPVAAATYTFAFVSGSADGTAVDVSGTWVAKTRATLTSAAADLTWTLSSSSASVGIIKASFTESQLQALTSGSSSYSGVYSIQKDTIPVYEGRFVVLNKASR